MTAGLSAVQLPMLACGREAMGMPVRWRGAAGPSCLPGARLSAAAASHRALRARRPSTGSAANSSPRPEVAPRPLNSSCPPRAFRDPAPVGECKAGQGLPDPHSIQLPQASRFTLSLKCFSSDSDICPPRGLDPCLSPPRAEGRSRPTDTPVFRRGRFTLPSLTRSCNTLSSSGQVLLSALSCCSARTCV